MANNIKGSASSGNTLVRSEQLNEDIVDVIKAYWEGGSFGHGLSIDSAYNTMDMYNGHVNIRGNRFGKSKIQDQKSLDNSNVSSLFDRIAYYTFVSLIWKIVSQYEMTNDCELHDLVPLINLYPY